MIKIYHNPRCSKSRQGLELLSESGKDFEIVKYLDIEAMGLTPASLRAGGATHKFSTGALDLGQLKFRGRWSALSTLEHYVQECTATLVMLRLSNETLNRLQSLMRFGYKFESPPPAPWESFFARLRQHRIANHGPAGSLSRCAGRRGHANGKSGIFGIQDRATL